MLIPKKLAKPYMQGIIYVFKNIKNVLSKRKSIQSTRKVNDKDFLTSGDMHVPGAYLSNPIYRIGINYFNKILTYYWSIIKNII